MTITRRVFVAAAAGASLAGASLESAQDVRAQNAAPQFPRFSYNDVVTRARDLATAPYNPSPPLPDRLAKLDLRAWGDIRFRPERAFFADSGGPFRLQLFQLGGPYKQAATINTIRDGIATPIPYASNLFDYGPNHFDAPLPVNLGFAGFRLHYPLNDSRVFDEAIAFLGASYFRFLGRGQRYGLSARGLAVDTGSQHEEFPFFREFWIETPTPNAERATIYALLDSASVTGAYRFDFSPGGASTLDVSATIFARVGGRKFGFVALTSMFCAGENDRRIRDDFRPERHDSDGLLMRSGAGEWIWRPLRNPDDIQTSAFLDDNPGGFGLLQRDRDFDHYQDVDKLYELHPSYWVTPGETWGSGRVELVELPTGDEDNDNIVAYWAPSDVLAAGQSKNLSYRIAASLGRPDPSPNGRVANTFETSAAATQANPPLAPNARRFLIDFVGENLKYYGAQPALVDVVPTAVNGAIVRSFLTWNPHLEGFRAGVDVVVDKGQSCDLRVFLKADGRALTETWTLPWRPA